DLRRDRRRGVVGSAPLAVVARVVGDDRPVGEVASKRREAAGAHRRADEEEGRLVGRGAGPDVVGERGARDLEGVRGLVAGGGGHRWVPSSWWRRMRRLPPGRTGSRRE